jgi:hypothetical protein
MGCESDCAGLDNRTSAVGCRWPRATHNLDESADFVGALAYLGTRMYGSAQSSEKD